MPQKYSNKEKVNMLIHIIMGNVIFMFGISHFLTHSAHGMPLLHIICGLAFAGFIVVHILSIIKFINVISDPFEGIEKPNTSQNKVMDGGAGENE